MHRAERKVKAKKHDPEVSFSPPLIEVVTEHLRPPEIKTTKEAQNDPTENYIVEVSHYVIGVGLLRVGCSE